jgi:hypothetical protein
MPAGPAFLGTGQNAEPKVPTLKQQKSHFGGLSSPFNQPKMDVEFIGSIGRIAFWV